MSIHGPCRRGRRARVLTDALSCAEMSLRQGGGATDLGRALRRRKRTADACLGT